MLTYIRICAAGLFLVLVAFPFPAAAQYPDRPIRLIIPFGLGGSGGLIAHQYAEKISEALGETLYIESRPGGGSTVGPLAVLHADPDGYTAGVVTSRALMKSAPYDSAQFAYVSILTRDVPYVVVAAKSPITSLAELLASKPESYAAPSSGAQYLGDELGRVAGITAVQNRIYKAEPAAVLDVLAGRVPYAIFFGPTTTSGVNGGTLRALAVMDGERSELLPDVPTIAEALRAAGKPEYTPGPGGYLGIVLPPQTPDDIVQHLAKAICKASHDKVLREKLRNMVEQVKCSTPEEFRAVAERMRTLGD